MNICIYFRAVTVADFYHRGGNGPTTAGGAMLWYIYISGALTPRLLHSVE